MIKVLSLFSGIGAFEKALDNQVIDYELVNYCENDPYPSKAYSVLHNISEDMNLGDITQIDTSKLPTDIDLLTHGSPCQDFSVAGRNAGGDEGSVTRSSLMWYTVDIVSHVKPKIVIWENVKGVLAPKHVYNFNKYLDKMNELGYNNYYNVLNAQDYGVPQSRERIFVVSIREDVDLHTFEFPKPIELIPRMRDFLEDEVNSRFFVGKDKVDTFIKNVNGKVDLTKACLGTCHYTNDMTHCMRDKVYNPDSVCPTLTATMYKDPPKILQLGNCIESHRINPSVGRVYDVNGVSPTLGTMQGGNIQPFVGVLKDGNFLLRKLTPRECFRLMGFDDSDFDKLVQAGFSNTRLYKMAGNSIVVDVLEHIYKYLFKSVRI